MVITFHPKTGFRMSRSHAAVGEIVTRIISDLDGGIRLFYIINRDPTLEELLGGADLSDPTHYLDLRLRPDERSLFQVKVEDVCVYSALVPAARAICNDEGGLQERMLKYEFYLEYSAGKSTFLTSLPP